MLIKIHLTRKELTCDGVILKLILLTSIPKGILLYKSIREKITFYFWKEEL